MYMKGGGASFWLLKINFNIRLELLPCFYIVNKTKLLINVFFSYSHRSVNIIKVNQSNSNSRKVEIYFVILTPHHGSLSLMDEIVVLLRNS